MTSFDRQRVRGEKPVDRSESGFNQADCVWVWPAKSRCNQANADRLALTGPASCCTCTCAATAMASAVALDPEISMMDYAWSEDKIDIDFMTGNDHQRPPGLKYFFTLRSGG